MDYVSAQLSELSSFELIIVVVIVFASLYMLKDIVQMLLAPPPAPYVPVKAEPPVQVPLLLKNISDSCRETGRDQNLNRTMEPMAILSTSLLREKFLI